MFILSMKATNYNHGYYPSQNKKCIIILVLIVVPFVSSENTQLNNITL